MAINKKLIHFKSRDNFDREVANENILDTSICFIQDSKEISTHGTLYKTVNWSVLDLGESKEIYICIPKLSAPFGDFIKSVQLEGVNIMEEAINFNTSIIEKTKLEINKVEKEIKTNFKSKVNNEETASAKKD